MPYPQNRVKGNDPFEMQMLAHPTYSADLAIADFDLSRILKQELQGVDGSDGEELISEILATFQGVPSSELKKII
jgi:hypothetical protein